jgi:AhpD family alkylhydroperoxidase
VTKSLNKSENDVLTDSVYLLELVKLLKVSLQQPISMGLVQEFNAYRSKMNEKIMASDSLIIKRIFNLDTNAYADGHLDVKSKELIGLTCSLVLRCDDCVKYHLGKCREAGLTTDEVQEAMGVATLVGGTIVIPHLRRAFEYWEELSHV